MRAFSSQPVLTRVGAREVADSERARDSDIDGQTTAMAPERDRDIARATTRLVGVAQDALLLHNGGQRALGADLVEEVANTVVSVDEVSVLCAACGVIAKNIDGLHAQ